LTYNGYFVTDVTELKEELNSHPEQLSGKILAKKKKLQT